MKICLFCGREMSEDNSSQLYNYFICKDCNDQMTDGITLFAVEHEPVFEKQEPICKFIVDDKEVPMYPTGEWATFSENAIEAFFGDKANKIIADGKAFVSTEVLEKIKKLYKDIKMKGENK